MTISFEVLALSKPPTLTDVRDTLKAYLGKPVYRTIGRMKGEPNTWAVRLAGSPNNPPAAFAHCRELANEGLFTERWFYVVLVTPEFFEVTRTDLAVKTRHPDEYTLAVMEGYAKFAARFWGGTLTI